MHVKCGLSSPSQVSESLRGCCPASFGATARWQAELTWGAGYLSVVWGYVGLGLLVALALELLMAVIRGPALRRTIPIVVSVGLAVLAACTFVSNFSCASVASGLGN